MSNVSPQHEALSALRSESTPSACGAALHEASSCPMRELRRVRVLPFGRLRAVLSLHRNGNRARARLRGMAKRRVALRRGFGWSYCCSGGRGARVALVAAAAEHGRGIVLSSVSLLLGQPMSESTAKSALRANPSIERTASGRLRLPPASAHVER